ncbi:S8 family serine peptidase [Streptomyces sp. NPDC014894]|uniref:S8 family peptidase n=1 Tax=Streptomyces sp. NPDC014894 TaxID=3364931 RepID=UPI0036FBE8CD
MHSRRRQNLGAATLTTAVAAALVAGLTAPASSASPALRGDTAAAAASAKIAGPAGKSGEGRAAGLRWVTLITGDRVGTDATGKAVALDRAEGREQVPVQTFTHRGDVYAVPHDARALLAEGRLDRRLFNITALSGADSRKAYRKGLKVIVAYEGASAATARQGLRATGDVRIGRSLPSLNADAVTVSEREAGALWEALTRTTSGKDARTAAVSGVKHIWLDGVRRASLDRSVAQVGAPQAWEAGYDGAGVKVAVLDTGVDDGHPDLKGRVVAAKNFSESTDAKDRDGHGTHVASTVAGTGVKSGGTHKGVAPGAEILNGKVLDDSGFGSDSGILAGMDWAVEQGADVINMSLGGPDGPEIDLMEAHVNKLTAEKGVLFAVAAGNSGPDAGSIGSPGSADAALTVGAVDDKDEMAGFSSVGPRVGGGTVKPDVTAPGVNIAAAAAAGTGPGSPEGYASLSGTSMATPHVAGAAALLKQRHPTWKADRLKSVLSASAKDGGHTPFQQGAGRLALDRAIRQSVVAEPGSVNFAKQAWPHHDDRPETRKVTYRNLGDRDVTLDVTVAGLDPQGKPAPAGFFALGARKVTVPAGGAASVDLTADTRVGDRDGVHTAAVVASDGAQSVRSVAAVEREPESYDLTVTFLGRDGRPNAGFAADLGSPDDADFGRQSLVNESGTAKVRVPKGAYVLDAGGAVDPANSTKGFDHLLQPKLVVNKNTTVTVDARRAEPVSITVPEKRARLGGALLSYWVSRSELGTKGGHYYPTLTGVRTAHLGPEVTDGSFSEVWATQWNAGSAGDYHTIVGGPAKKYSTGYTKRFKAADFAKVKANAAASAKNKRGGLFTISLLGSASFFTNGPEMAFPGSRTQYVAASPKATVSLGATQFGPKDPDGHHAEEIWYGTADKKYSAGKSYTETLGGGVHSPKVAENYGVFRDGDQIIASTYVHADAAGHDGASDYTSARTTLHRGKTKIGENADPLLGREPFDVGAGDAEYTLATSVKRDRKVAATAARTDAAWTFRSKRPAAGELVALPVSSVRFTPKLALDDTAPAGRQHTFPVTVEGPAAGKGLKSLTVSVSYNGGKTWKKVTVAKNRITVKNPAEGKAISLRAQLTDKKNNKSAITVYDAYFGK